LNEGDIGGAVAAIRAAVAMREELTQAWPSVFRRDLVESLTEGSRILNDADLSEEAFAMSLQAIALAREFEDVGREDQTIVHARALQAHSRSALAAKHWRAGLDAVDAEIALCKEMGKRTQSLLMLARALHNRATFLTMLERDREAMESLNDSIQLHATLLEKPDGAAQLLSGSMHLAGSLAARGGNLEGSASWFKQAVELRVAQRASQERLADSNITQSSIEWANASARLGRTQDVAVATQHAVTALSALAKDDASAFNLTRLAHGFLQLGNVKRRLGDLDAAIVAYRSAAALKLRLEDARGNGALAVTAARKLIACLKRAGRTEESEAWRQRFSITDRG
jgi:tetratricopeptide (TPR) repeat protein